MPKAITLYSSSSSRLRRDAAEPLYVRLWGRATALLADSDEPVPLDGWVEAALDNGLTCLLPVLAALDLEAPAAALTRSIQEYVDYILAQRPALVTVVARCPSPPLAGEEVA